MARSDFGFQIGSALATQYLTDSKYVRAGYIAVNTIAERDALPVDTGNGGVIVEGSLVYVSAEELFYQYDGSAWIEAEFGGGSQAYVVSTTDEPGFASTNQEITITTSFTDTEGTTHNVEDLKVGETIYVEESTYPNRWVADVYSEEPPGPTPGRLPEAYQEVQYLQSSGTQYIQLPYGFNNTDEIDFKFSEEYAGQTADKYMIAPSSWNTNQNRFGMGRYSLYTFGYGAVATGSTTLQPSTPYNDNLPHTWHYKDFVCSVDEPALSLDVSSISFGGETTNLRLFYGYNSNTKGAIYSYKQKKIVNGVLTTVLDLVPCYRKSDSVAGMYDKSWNDTKCGTVDLGTLTWIYRGNGVFSCFNMIDRQYGNRNVYVEGYITAPNDNYGSFNDRECAGGAVASTKNVFHIKDTRYTDAATFKQAMSGKILYYQRETDTTWQPPFYTNQGTGSFIVGPDANAVSNENTILSEGELVYKAKLFRVGKVDPADVTKAYVDTQDQAEATARAAADTTLQTNITNEATARANADTTLQTNITNEATARQTADTTLQTNITNEATTRATADTLLETNKEDKSNKTIILSSASTDDQYPSAKAVYDFYTTISGYDPTKTQTLKIVNGALTWIDD